VTKLTSKKEKPKKAKPPETKPEEEQPLAEESVEKPAIIERPPQSHLKALVYPFNVLVSPLKTFKQMVQYPDIMGLALIIGLLLLSSAVVQYAAASKIILNINAQPVSLLESSYFQSLLITGMIESVFLFVLNWAIFAGALLLITTLMGAKGGSWRLSFILVGYAFTVFVVRTVITAALVSTLPQLNLSNLSSWPPSTETEQTYYFNQVNSVWGPSVASQALQVVNFAVDVWLVILGTIAVRVYREISWSKAAIIAVTAYLMFFTLRLFLGF